MSATRNALVGLLGSVLVLAGCASSGATSRAGWAERPAKQDDALPTVAARNDEGVEVDLVREVADGLRHRILRIEPGAPNPADDCSIDANWADGRCTVTTSTGSAPSTAPNS